MNNEDWLLEQLNPEMKRIYKAVKTLQDNYQGTGSIEVHFFKGKIKIRNGLYMKPSFSDENDYLEEVQK